MEIEDEMQIEDEMEIEDDYQIEYDSDCFVYNYDKHVPTRKRQINRGIRRIKRNFVDELSFSLSKNIDFQECFINYLRTL